MLGGYYKSSGETSVSIGTRTPISFGTILSKTLSKFMPEMEKIEEGSDENYLYYLYRKLLTKNWYGFAMFQAARRRGAFTVEVGLSMRKIYPCYWSTAKPDYAIDGVRNRLAFLIEDEDKWWTYSNAFELENCLESSVRGTLSEGIQKLWQSHHDRMENLFREWHERVNFYRSRINARSETNPVEIFPDLPNITDVYEYIQDQLRLRTFDKLYPNHIRSEMKTREFIILQSCLMSDIIEKPETPQYALMEERAMDFKDDIIHAIVGRMPRETYIIPTEDEREAYLRYAYFLSMSILESIIGIEKEEKENNNDR